MVCWDLCDGAGVLEFDCRLELVVLWVNAETHAWWLDERGGLLRAVSVGLA
jgi:hypothetical protein